MVHDGLLRLLPAGIRSAVSGRPNLHKVVANTGWLFGDRVIRIGMGMVVSVFVARYLGPERYGLLNFSAALVALFGVLGTLGLDSIVIKDLVNRPEAAEDILGAAFGLKLAGAAGVVVVSVAAVSLVRPGDTLVLVLTALAAGGFIAGAFDTIDFWFQSRVESKFSVMARNTAFLATAALRVYLVRVSAPLVAFAWGGLVELSLGALGLLVVYRLRGFSIRKWRPSLGHAKRLIEESWPLILSGLAVMIYMRVGQVLLGQMAGDEAVGVYSAAARLSEAWYFVPMAIVSSVFPSVVRLRQVDETAYYRRLQRLFSLMVVLAVSVALPVSLLAGDVVGRLYGEGYEVAAGVLRVHVWAGLFVCLGVARHAWVVAEGLMRFSFATTVLGALTNLCLCVLLIPRFGPLGAAWALLAAQGVSVSFSTLIYPATRRIFTMQVRAVALRGLL